MNRYFIDTSVIVDYLHDDSNAVAFVTNLKGKVTSSYLCLAELYEGVYRSDRNQQIMEESIRRFFEGLSTIYKLDYDIAQCFGQIRASLKQKGSVIEDIDIFLAATCLAHNLVMVTYNEKHFRRIPELRLLSPLS